MQECTNTRIPSHLCICAFMRSCICRDPPAHRSRRRARLHGALPAVDAGLSPRSFALSLRHLRRERGRLRPFRDHRWSRRTALVLRPDARAFLLIGVLGGFTTFSTFAFESFELLRDGQFMSAAVNVVGQVVAGIVGLWAGFVISG